MPWDAPGSTAVVVRTPEADAVMGGWYQAHSKAGAEGMRPHITLLVPFVPGDLIDADVSNRLRSAVSIVKPFEYALTRVRRWPGGIMYLSPQPARPFTALTRVLMDEFPGYLPYEGVHDDVIPHATVAVSDDEALLAQIAADVGPRLPIACKAVEATVVQRGVDLRWRTRATVPLGSLE